MTAPLVWSICLEERPRLVHGGHSIHGQVSTERYRMRNLWCIHFYQYAADLRLDDRWFAVRPGCVSVIPPGVEMEFQFRGVSKHTFAHFTLPAGPGQSKVPAMNEAPHGFSRLQEGIHLVVRTLSGSRLRAEVKLWDLLWELAATSDAKEGTRSRQHPACLQARELIELRLGQPLDIAQLAKEVGISHNQLTRIFRRETGGTILAYIHRCRAQRSHHLLLDTTLPIKAVAEQVGIPDPHHFNKFVRRMLGASPTGIRRGDGRDH